jgi:aminoglycoside phosphotransferase (APT) family kinase protein
MDEVARAICQKEGLQAHEISPLTAGQVNQVYRVDGAYVLRIGARADAAARLRRESELLRQLAGLAPVARIYASGEYEGQAYQIQSFLAGQNLLRAWPGLEYEVQRRLAGEFAGYLRAFRQISYPAFGSLQEGSPAYVRWEDYLRARFQDTLSEIARLRIALVPGFIELAQEYFEQHSSALESGLPSLVHSDLAFGNLLVQDGHISAILDFEFALAAPNDYEFHAIEDFCLYPNDFAEEDDEIYTSADFAGFGALLRRQAPDLFDVPRLAERLSLYHLSGTLSSYLAWRKANLDTIPAESVKAGNFYMARITNAIFRHGARLF